MTSKPQMSNNGRLEKQGCFDVQSLYVPESILTTDLVSVDPRTSSRVIHLLQQLCKKCFISVVSVSIINASWRLYKYCSFRRSHFRSKSTVTARTIEEEEASIWETWRCLDYTRSWFWCPLWLSWPWWDRPRWWGPSLSTVPPVCRRNWTTVRPSRQTAGRCWRSLAAAAAWPAPWIKEHPAGFTQPTVARVSAASPGPVRPGLSTLWPEDRGSALRMWAMVSSKLCYKII